MSPEYTILETLAPPLPPQLYALVLAAGASSRFGASKQLQAFHGQPLVRRAMRLAESCCGGSSVLVTGSHWREVLQAAAPLRGFFVHNDRFRLGMASSIASGVQAVSESADGVLLLLADQPLIDKNHLTAMIDEWTGAPERIVATAYAGTVGPPVILPRTCFAELRALTGDRGARSVLQRHAAAITSIAFEDAAADIDTPQDLEGLRQR